MYYEIHVVQSGNDDRRLPDQFYGHEFALKTAKEIAKNHAVGRAKAFQAQYIVQSIMATVGGDIFDGYAVVRDGQTVCFFYVKPIQE